MHVEITIVAKDYDKGQQCTKTEEFEVPGRTLKLYEIFTQGDQGELLRWVADTVFGVAVREVQGSGKSGNLGQAMTDAGGGRVGGRGASGENKAADTLAEQLGLDVLRAGVAKDQGQTTPPPQAVQQAPQAPQAPPAGPGPVGFGSPPQQQVGPGPVGFGANRPINPGQGPGPIGFGPNRGK